MFDLKVGLVLSNISEIGDKISQFIKENLIPNWLDFAVQFGALVVMILVFFLVGYKRVRKMLNKRADYVENNIRDSETAKAESERNAKASQEVLVASKKEAAEIIAAAKQTAINNQKQIIDDAHLEVNKIKAQAEEDIERSKEEAKEEIRKEMISVALTASEEVLKREINEKDNARIVEDFIKDID